MSVVTCEYCHLWLSFELYGQLWVCSLISWSWLSKQFFLSLQKITFFFARNFLSKIYSILTSLPYFELCHSVWVVELDFWMPYLSIIRFSPYLSFFILNTLQKDTDFLIFWQIRLLCFFVRLICSYCIMPLSLFSISNVTFCHGVHAYWPVFCTFCTYTYNVCRHTFC